MGKFMFFLGTAFVISCVTGVPYFMLLLIAAFL